MTEETSRQPGAPGEPGESCFELNDRIRRSSASEGEPGGEDYFVLDLQTGKYFSLGEVGGFIWERLDGTKSLGEIAQALTAAFTVGDEEAEADVVEFVGRLETLGLIQAG